MANFSGKVHGGAILRLLDQVAYACGSRYAARYVVTLSVDQVMFRQPIMVGELVTFMASVNYTGKSSMEIGIRVVAENIRTQEVRHANSCFFTMVAVDDEGKPVAIPRCAPSAPRKSAASRRPRRARRCASSSRNASPRHTAAATRNDPLPESIRRNRESTPHRLRSGQAGQRRCPD